MENSCVVSHSTDGGDTWIEGACPVPSPTPDPSTSPTPTPTPTPGPSSNIFVCKYNDEDKDGEWDKGEDGIANWDITITKSLPRAVEISEEIIEDQTEVIEVETGEDGCVDLYVDPYYTYKVEEVQKTGWVQTAPSDPSYCEAYITDYDKYDTRVGQIIDIIDENPTQETQTLYCDFGNYKERRSGGSGTQSGRNRDSSSTPVSTPRPTDSGDVLGEATTTTTPTPTQEVLVRTGFSILGIGAIGALNLQLGLLLNERFRRNIFSILSKII